MESTTSLRSERFEIAFNKIHLELKKMVKNETPHFRNLVFKGAKKFSIIKPIKKNCISLLDYEMPLSIINMI